MLSKARLSRSRPCGSPSSAVERRMPAHELATTIPPAAPPTLVGERDCSRRGRRRDRMPCAKERAGWDRPPAPGWRQLATQAKRAGQHHPWMPARSGTGPQSSMPCSSSFGRDRRATAWAAVAFEKKLHAIRSLVSGRLQAVSGETWHDGIQGRSRGAAAGAARRGAQPDQRRSSTGRRRGAGRLAERAEMPAPVHARHQPESLAVHHRAQQIPVRRLTQACHRGGS